jgi:hypothetical protein
MDCKNKNECNPGPGKYFSGKEKAEEIVEINQFCKLDHFYLFKNYLFLSFREKTSIDKFYHPFQLSDAPPVGSYNIIYPDTKLKMQISNRSSSAEKVNFSNLNKKKSKRSTKKVHLQDNII